MSTSWARRLLLPAALAVLAGCVTTNPRTSFEATRALLAGRHSGELVWPRLEAFVQDFAAVPEAVSIK